MSNENEQGDSNPTLLLEHTESEDETSIELREEDLQLHEKWETIKRLHDGFGFRY